VGGSHWNQWLGRRRTSRNGNQTIAQRGRLHLKTTHRPAILRGPVIGLYNDPVIIITISPNNSNLNGPLSALGYDPPTIIRPSHHKRLIIKNHRHLKTRRAFMDGTMQNKI